MKKIRLISLGLGLFLATRFLGSATAEQQPEQKIIIKVTLDPVRTKSHAQLQLLKNMDVLGVNYKKNIAEVSVTQEELASLKAQGLQIRQDLIRTHELTTAATALNDYLNPDKTIAALATINVHFPQLTKVFEIGKTHKNRSINALEISTHIGDPNYPVVVFNAMHHAREVMTTEVVMHIANVLTEQYGSNAEVTNWLDHFRIIVVPQVNPDGNAMVHNGQNMWRKNAYEVSGVVRGVDLNRNYPGYWNYCNGSSSSLSSETYRGPSAGSEPEAQAMMNLVSHLKPVADISYHSYSELIIYPYGCSSVKNPSRDLFRSVGQAMNEKILDDTNQPNSYALGTAPELLYEADGSDLDWQWKEHGVLAYTIEVNASDFQPNYKTWRDITIKRQEGGWQALLRRMMKSGLRAQIQTADANFVTYSLKKVTPHGLMAFDADAPERQFSLHSKSGLLYQISEEGDYEITFFVNKTPIKTMNVKIGEDMLDLGFINL